jgi:hypothetical protein
MDSLKINEAGKKYHRLTILGDAGISRKRKMILCRCVCGTEKVIEARQVTKGLTKSCGCLRRDVTRTNYRKRNIVSKWANPLDSVDDDIITGG